MLQGPRSPDEKPFFYYRVMFTSTYYLYSYFMGILEIAELQNRLQDAGDLRAKPGVLWQSNQKRKSALEDQC